MDYKTELVSSQSSFNFVTRFLIARSEPADAAAPTPKRSKAVTRGQNVLSVILFIAIFFGLLSALGAGLSELGDNTSLSQTVTKYVRLLS